ncbi:hypothetical protein DPQ33_17120 [Oceanidesulfovibrio indonesiensis]|uniref:Uncharacterized protein n=1 Tax=Oceanidesulfovibrio indonesiensis TaxID=54767 RepID=A0A7M3MAC7_9BACT|nr:hypothetical protein [Oceanidesulfovibrio indonesiensis]TVM14588.1 hypothetical protein DPQ33_17120 [Oceanidesulfovibrio indonesiensis]
MTGLNTRQKIAVLTMDVLLLLELTLCVYFSYQDKANMPYLFMRSYIPLCLGTLITFKILIHKLRTKEIESEVACSEA